MYLTNTTQATNLTSLYQGTLDANSTTFIRSNNSAASNSTERPYYYQTVRFAVNETGVYVIASSSSFDSFGYLYENRFDPNDATSYLLLSDDDSAGERQFALRANLRANVVYIVVVTSYNPQESGSYSVNVSGPSVARFNA